MTVSYCELLTTCTSKRTSSPGSTTVAGMAVFVTSRLAGRSMRVTLAEAVSCTVRASPSTAVAVMVSVITSPPTPSTDSVKLQVTVSCGASTAPASAPQSPLPNRLP